MKSQNIYIHSEREREKERKRESERGRDEASLQGPCKLLFAAQSRHGDTQLIQCLLEAQSGHWKLGTFPQGRFREFLLIKYR